MTNASSAPVDAVSGAALMASCAGFNEHMKLLGTADETDIRMSAAVKITRTDHTPSDLRVLAAKCNDGAQVRRLLVLC